MCYEGYGIVFDEVLVQGLFIVSCVVGVVFDMVLFVVGLLVLLGDVLVFVIVLCWLLSDFVLCGRMVCDVFVIGKVLFSWDDIVCIVSCVIDMIGVC